MDVDLGGIETLVTEPLLDLEGAHAMLGLDGGKRVAQSVNTGLLLNPGPSGVLGHKLLDAALGDRFAILVQEQMSVANLSPNIEVALDRPNGLPFKGHTSFLLPL